MTVLHLDCGTGWRGGQQQALLLAAGLAARGVGGAVACPAGSPLAERTVAARLDTFALQPRGDLDLAAALRLARLARRTGADVVHAHDARSHAAALLAGLLGGRRWRLVVTRRTAFARRHGPFTRLKYGRGVDRFIAISGAVRDGLLAAGAASARVRVVYSGVQAAEPLEPEDWRARLGLSRTAAVVGSVGALSGEKGYAVLVDALALLPERVHAVLVGEGPLAAALAQRAEASGVAARLHLAGRTDRPRAAMAGFDVYVQPSRAEGLGTAVLDALALGLPAVTTRAGGLAEVVEPGVSGLQVESGDAAALARALRRLLDDEALRARLSHGARARAAAFTAEAMVEGTLAVYHELLGEG